MMAITTNNSMRVKAFARTRAERDAVLFIDLEEFGLYYPPEAGCTRTNDRKDNKSDQARANAQRNDSVGRKGMA